MKRYATRKRTRGRRRCDGSTERFVVGDPRRVAALRADRRWFEAHREQLEREHPDEYLAIVNGAIVDADRDFVALTRRIYERRESLVFVGFTGPGGFDPPIATHGRREMLDI